MHIKPLEGRLLQSQSYWQHCGQDIGIESEEISVDIQEFVIVISGLRDIKFRVELFEAKRNFGNNQKYKNERFLCDSCENEVDENTHVLFCPSYSTLREGKDLNNDTDLANYLYKVLSIRMKLRLER